MTALLPIAGAYFVLASTTAARAETAPSHCEEAAGLSILPAPYAPWKGAPLHVMFAAEKPLDGELSLIAPDGSVAAKSSDRHDGPPYFWFVEVETPAAGTWHASLTRAGETGDCRTVTRDIAVSDRKPPGPPPAGASMWAIRNSWNRETENLYSAWIEKLFDAPLDATPSWKTWRDVLHDKSRNFMFNYLGLGEDNGVLPVRPDCADFVYFLRA